MVDWAVLIDCMIIDQAIYSGRNNCFRWLLIHDGYPLANTQILMRLALLHVLLNQCNRDKGALFLPKPGQAFINCCCSTLFCLLVPQQSKIIPRKKVSYLDTTEGRLKLNMLLQQLSYNKKWFKSSSWK